MAALQRVGNLTVAAARRLRDRARAITPAAGDRLGRAELERLLDEERARSVRLVAEAEQAEIAERRRLEMALELADVGTWEIDVDTHNVLWSPGLYQIVGRDPSGFTPTMQSVSGIVHPDDRDALDEFGVHALRDGSAGPLEVRVLRPDGEVRWCIDRGHAVRDGHLVGILRDVTDERGTQRRLEADRVLWDLAQSITHLGTAHVDMSTAQLTWSPEMYRIAGRDPDDFELTFQSGLDVIHPDDIESVSQRVLDVDGVAAAAGIEARLLRPDGSCRRVHLQSAAVGDDRLVITCWDITERREAEERREADRQRLTLAVEMARFGAWEADLDHDTASWSPEVFRILGLAPGSISLSPKTLRNFVHPDDLERYRRAAADALAGGTPSPIEVRFKRPDGDLRWVRIDGRMIAPGRLAGFSQDVTEQRIRENAAREQAERLRTLQEHAPIGIGYIGLDGQLIEANEAMAQILGRLRAELTEITVADLVLPEDLHLVFDGRRAFLAGETDVHQAEVRFARPDGRTIWALVNTSPLRHRSGEPEGYLAHIVDITDRKAGEEALRAQAVEVERANQAKTAFLSRMSHELRTPLNAVLGYAQLLELSVGEPGDEEAVSHILRAGRHLLALIDEVLDISGVEAGTVELRPEPVDVATALDEAVQLVLPMAEEHRIRIVPPTAATGASRQAPSALVDRRRMHQILLNLLSNSIKYNHPGGQVTLDVTESDRVVRITVTDTGRGIAPDAMGRVFEPFDRLGAEQLGIQGTGIGLPLARSLAERMDGTISVTSMPGEGSAFTLTLPTAGLAVGGPGSVPGRGDDEPRERGEAEAGPPTGPSLDDARLLVVNIEDNPANQRLVAAVLRRRPTVHLVTVPDAATGRAAIAEHRPGLVLLDLHLPDGSGLDLLRELPAPGTAGRPMVVMVSADAGPDQINAALALGADNYLTKPIDVATLLAVVDDATAQVALAGRPERQGS